jgi:hypothetical protein
MYKLYYLGIQSPCESSLTVCSRYCGRPIIENKKLLNDLVHVNQQCIQTVQSANQYRYGVQFCP